MTGPWGCGASARSRRRLGSARSAPSRKNVLIFPRAAAVGIGWRRGHWRRGRAARCGGGAAGGWRLGRWRLGPGLRSRSAVLVVPPSAVLGAAAGFGTPGADSGGGFAARARTAGHCSCFYDGPPVADDPVARRRPFELGPPRSGIREA
jgi:hypothetical protein